MDEGIAALISIIVAIPSVYSLSKKLAPKELDHIETRKFRVFARRTSWVVCTLWLMSGLSFMLSGNYALEGNPWWMPIGIVGFVMSALLPAWYFSTIPSLESKFGPNTAGIIEGLIWVDWFLFIGMFFFLVPVAIVSSL